MNALKGNRILRLFWFFSAQFVSSTAAYLLLTIAFSFLPVLAEADPGNGGHPGLFHSMPAPAGPVPSPAKMLRTGYVQFDRTLLDGFPGRFKHPGSDPGFKLNLFDDVQTEWTVDRIRMRSKGGWVAWGSIPGQDGGRVVMAYRNGILQADVWVPGHSKFEVRYFHDGLHRISETNPAPGQVLLDGGAEAPGPTGAEWVASQGVPTFYPQAVQSGCPNSQSLKVSQIMVLYTALAAENAGGAEALETLIDMDWAGMNMAFYNSGVTAEMELVATQPVTYAETGDVITDLGNLTNPAYFPQLGTWMATYGANYVSLFVGSAATTTGGGIVAGVGQLPGFATVCYYPYADVAFPHEVGHNMGCHHDRQTDGVPSGNGFNYGYRFASGGTTFITIMAYQPGNWILNYSNPAVNFMGQPTGIDPASSTAADNALEINQNFPNTPYTGAYPLPTVQISSPLAGSYLPSTAPLTLTALASDTGGTVAQIDFMVNDLYAGSATSAPYTLVWTPPSAGTYYISADAINNQGGVKASCPNEIYVSVATATVTPTFTNSFTPTPTFTFTLTPTRTITPTPTITFTPPATPTIGSPTATTTPDPPPPCCAEGNSTIALFAGTGAFGDTGNGGQAALATLGSPQGIYSDWAGNVYIADTGELAVRKVSTSGIISLFAGGGTGAPGSGDGGPATLAACSPQNVTGDLAGNIYICDVLNINRVRMVNTAGIINAFAGTGSFGYTGDGGPATLATLDYPFGVAADGSGNVYIADGGNNAIRKVNANGIITTIAGTGTAGYSGDNGPATLAQLNDPQELVLDPSGNLYISDALNYRVRKVDTNGVITTIAGTGTSGFSGDGGQAVTANISSPTGLVYCGGSVYFSDGGNYRIRQVNPSGIITNVCGNGTTISSGNGGPASLAGIYPAGLAVDGQGNLYEAEPYGLLRGYDGGDHVRKLEVSCPPTATFTRTQTTTLTPTATATPTGTIPTPTVTSTFTLTSPPTETATPTSTMTATPTPTVSFTATATSSVTTTPTATPQVIGDTYPAFTNTSTSSLTPTFTPTATSTLTPTVTFTYTPSSTPTPSATVTPTGTPTLTATLSFTPTITGTPTNAPTFTSTFTSTHTSINTLTPTATFSATPTRTPTLTTTPTVTLTPTISLTPTPTVTGVAIGLPYPNPVQGPGPVSIHLDAPTGSTVEWSVVTTAFRKVLDVSHPVEGHNAVLVWNLEDAWEKPVANGVYYLRIQITGPIRTSKILKILVIR
jgi:hypothetical protein